MSFFLTKRFLTLLSLMLFASLFLLIYLNIKQNKMNQEAAELVNHTYQVINHSERMQFLITQEVMAARGYLISGDSNFLQVIPASRKELATVRQSLENKVGNNSNQDKRLKEICSYVDTRKAITDSIDILRSIDSAAAMKMVQSGRGKVIMDSINAKFNEFKFHEFKLLTTRQQAFDSSKGQLDLTQIIMLFLVTLVSSTFIFLFYRFLIAQQSFMKEAQFKSTVLESISEAVVLTDVNFKITAWNKKAEMQYGYTQKEAFGKKLGDVLGVKQSYYRSATLQQLLRYGKWQGEVVHFHKDGSPLTVLASVTMLDAGNGNYMGSVSVFRDISERKRMEMDLLETNQSLEDLLAQKLEETQVANVQLRELNKGLKEAREDERKKISRELHDDLGQVLTSSRINMSYLLEEIKIEDDNLRHRFEELVKTLDRSINWVRNLAMELRPIQLEDLGLFQAITTHVEKFSKEVNIQVEILNEIPELIIDNEKGTHIFRILQEALNNVAKHAQATLVTITLTIEEDMFVMVINDNGKGFDHSKAHKKSLGLTTIKERTKILNGNYSIQSFPGKGTEVKLLMPLIEED